MISTYFGRQGRLLVLLVLAGVVAGCGPTVNIKNTSEKATAVYVSIPESSGRTLIHLEPGADGATELGESGVYTVYVMADEIVTNALKKVRDDLETKLQQASSPADIKDLTEKLH